MRDNAEMYVPYQATAEAIATADESPRLFLLSLFPDATSEQMGSFYAYTTGKILDGIHLGLKLHDADPMSPLDAYKFGVEEGFDRSEQRKSDNGGSI